LGRRTRSARARQEHFAVILLIGPRDEAHLRHIQRRLDEKGAPSLLFSLEDLPSRASLEIALDDVSPLRARMRKDDRGFDLGAVRSAWLHRRGFVTPSKDFAPLDRDFVESELHSVLFGTALAMTETFWVNPPMAAVMTDGGRAKIAQLELARRLGLRIPRTCVTNDPDAARAFVRSCAEGAIFKAFEPPLRNVAKAGEPEELAVLYTTRVDAQIEGQLDGIREAPCQFQELVPKTYELRITVMGNRVFATEIHSQQNELSRIDFRQQYALGTTPYFAHSLPPKVEEKCIRLVRGLGLVFGVLDMIRTPEGEYVFLEVNQQGAFLWLEEMTGQPLIENMCELLIQARVDFRCDAPAHAPGPLSSLPDLVD
jgi:glutathione synthase/RimK-type ligase-like ATP-grasp enzyme